MFALLVLCHPPAPSPPGPAQPLCRLPVLSIVYPRPVAPPRCCTTGPLHLSPCQTLSCELSPPPPPLPQVLRKEKEALAKKQRLVEQGLAAVNADMAEFQKEKQGRLNQVEVVVALRMHQVGVG